MHHSHSRNIEPADMMLSASYLTNSHVYGSPWFIFNDPKNIVVGDILKTIVEDVFQ